MRGIAPAAKVAEVPPAAAAAGGGGGGENGNGGGSAGVSEALNRLVKWIPGDVMALYVAAVTVFSGDDGNPSLILLAIAILAAALFVIGAAFAKSGEIQPAVLATAAINAGAFTIWSVTVPLSGWQRIDWINGHQAGVTVIAAFLAALYCLFAEGMAIALTPKGDAG